MNTVKVKKESYRAQNTRIFREMDAQHKSGIVQLTDEQRDKLYYRYCKTKYKVFGFDYKICKVKERVSANELLTMIKESIARGDAFVKENNLIQLNYSTELYNLFITGMIKLSDQELILKDKIRFDKNKKANIDIENKRLKGLRALKKLKADQKKHTQQTNIINFSAKFTSEIDRLKAEIDRLKGQPNE